MRIFAFILILIGYVGIIRIQRKWYTLGVLTESKFVLFQVPVLSLFVLSGFLAYSTTLRNIAIGVVLSSLCLILGIPGARLIYEKRFSCN